MPILTRWTSHFLSCRRLLLLEKAIRTLVINSREVLEICAGDKADAKRKAKEILDYVALPSFWDNLRTVKRHLKPLAVATNATQSNHARLDIVLMTLAHLFHIFSNPKYDLAVRDAIQNSLEKRWKQTDQEVFILALLFNPYLRRKCFNPHNPVITESTLWSIVERRYKEMFGQDPDLEFSQAFTDYLHYLSEFSDAAMGLEKQQQMAEAAKTDVNLVNVWRRLDCGAKNGRNGLVSLAMRILSIVPNSAATERIFSIMGIVHTSLRNRLEMKKVRATALIRGDTDKKYPAPQRKRRSCGDEDTISDDEGEAADRVDASSSSVECEDGASFAEVVSHLFTQAQEHVDIERWTDTTGNTAHSIPVSQREGLLLRNLFIYPSDSQFTKLSDLSNFWKRAKQNLETEEVYHDMMHSPSGSE